MKGVKAYTAFIFTIARLCTCGKSATRKDEFLIKIRSPLPLKLMVGWQLWDESICASAYVHLMQINFFVSRTQVIATL